ncbi:MAG: class I SAM-dependent methyltransferase [Micropruina sp.]|uniref:class I SAM-dependent methyltransferase n=1 Tax=Micropruina sp. TaxID=2737536 RepID=UPI0039E5FCA9
MSPASTEPVIESAWDAPGSVYDRGAATYDAMVGSRLYNRLAWNTDPADYAAFARRAVDSGDGPLLDVAAGTCTATADAYLASRRPIVITDRSRGMLTLAAQRLAVDGRPRPDTRFVQADAFALPFPPRGFETVVCLGFLHLVDDPAEFVAGLRAQLRPGGRLFVSSLVAATPVGTRYLRFLHRLGEMATPRTADQLADMFGVPVRRRGSMAYLELDA